MRKLSRQSKAREWMPNVDSPRPVQDVKPFLIILTRKRLKKRSIERRFNRSTNKKPNKTGSCQTAPTSLIHAEPFEPGCKAKQRKERNRWKTRRRWYMCNTKAKKGAQKTAALANFQKPIISSKLSCQTTQNQLQNSDRNLQEITEAGGPKHILRVANRMNP